MSKPGLIAFLCTAALAAGNPIPAGPNDWAKTYGWKAKYQANLHKPAVLLIHGLAATQQTWTAPTRQWNLRKLAYNPKSSPSVPEVSVTDPFNHKWSSGAPGTDFWGALDNDFNLATWNQVPCIANADGMPSNACLASDTFEKAYESAQWALQKLLAETRGPVTLLAHSRGGLIARRLLKDFGDADGRIKRLITIHSPHSGTSVATKPDLVYGEFTSGLADLLPVKEWREKVTGGLGDIQDAMLNLTGLPGARELATHLVPAKVREGEKALPGVVYTTFGGTSTTLVKLHFRTYTVTKDYPFFTKTEGSKAFFQNKAFIETTQGKGDSLVSDDSAKLPWLGAKHHSNPLHHGEVLWNSAVINQVKGLVGGNGN